MAVGHKRDRAHGAGPWAGSFDLSDYPRGSIKSIRLRDFMTYKDAIVYPGPRLNLVLGPNGSGKSSVVVAVGVALCSPLKMLGRASDIKEMVRKGAEKGSVELLISGGPNDDDVKIERTISLGEHGRSSFKINGVPRNQKDVEALNKKLNIQLDNLCQFLPQEKVVEFSKMGPRELLQSTERAIGNGDLLRKHERLINGSIELKEFRDREATSTRQLEKKVGERDNLHRDVEKIQEHDRKRKEAKMMLARIAQLDEAEAKADMQARNRTHREIQEKLAELQQQMEAQRGPQKAMQHEINKLKEAERKAQARAAEISASVDRWANVEVDSADQECTVILTEIKDLERKEDVRQKRLRDSRDMLNVKVDELDGFPEHPAGYNIEQERQLKAQRQAVLQQQSDLSKQRSGLDHERMQADQEKHAARTAIQRLQAVKEERLQVCDNIGKHRGKLVQFKAHLDRMIRDNRFRNQVMGPVGVEVTLRADVPAHAAMAIEAAVAGRIWHSFVTNDDQDNNLLRAEMKAFGMTGFNVINQKDNVSAMIPHRLTPSEGFDPALNILGSLDTFIDAPMLIKHTLMATSRLNDTYLIAGDDFVEEAFRRTQIMLFFSPTKRHQKTQSLYSAAGISFSVGAIFGKNLLTIRVDEPALRRQEEIAERASGRLAQIEHSMHALSQKEQEVQHARTELEGRLNTLQRMRQDHTRAKSKLEAMLKTLRYDITQHEKQSPLLKKPELEKKLVGIRKKYLKQLEGIVQTRIPEQLKHLCSASIAAARRAALMDEILALETERQQGQAELGELQRGEKDARQQAAQAKEQYQHRSTQWRQAQSELSAEERAKLDTYSKERDECEARADELQREAEAINVADRGLVDRYKKLLEEIEKMQGDVAEQHDKALRLQNELEEAQNTWLPELREKVLSISGLFSSNFKRIGSVGEIRLYEAGEEYQEYAVEIRIKFRPEDDLMTLDPSRHSGGEKSVSTIMYLLSLQKITTTPFRIIDEINQGMDQTNERKVFQAMVDAATERNTAQCLLMTPKLLPQLVFSENVNVLSIMNGVHIAGATKALQPSKQLKLLLGAAYTEPESAV